MGEITEERKKLLDSLFEVISLISEGNYVYICDMEYDYSRWSKAAVDVFDLPSEYMYRAGDIWEEHIHPEDRGSYHRSAEEIFSGSSNRHDMQYRALKADGKYAVCTCRGVVIKNRAGIPAYFTGVIRNHGLQGHMDTLTGLRNQYSFFEDLQSRIKDNTPCCICMVGISKFTEINEVYGYHFGNTVLQRFGRYLYDRVGDKGNIYRLDGTKFALISDVLTVEEARNGYDRLRAYFRKGIKVDGADISLEMNCGYLTLDEFEVNDQTIYACLNFAYGESKNRRQGDAVRFYNDVTDESRHRIEMLNTIRLSIPSGCEGFYLLYQPVVDARSEKISGAEALLRWKSDDYDVVPPDLFIPVLETDPQFPELGRWILRTALTEAKRMFEDNPDFVVNVNLSYTQLERPDFVDRVKMILQDTDYPPDHLCLELTERCRLLDIDLLKNAITNLRGIGIKVALDDFGTGFSSIGLVKALPLDTIKIDRSFVSEIEHDNMERQLIRHFTDLAATFGARVCVEGIETSAMRDILREYSVNSFQGYYYSKPIVMDELLKWEPKTANV